MTDAPKLATEMTPEGEQIVAPGMKPITLKDRLSLRLAAAMAPKRNPNAPQKACDIGLFDEAARNQLDMLDFLRAAKIGASSPPKPKEQTHATPTYRPRKAQRRCHQYASREGRAGCL